MPPMPTHGGWTHSPLCGTLQTVAEGGIPWGAVKDPPKYGATDVSGRNYTAHVAHRGYPIGVWMNIPGPNSKRGHQHMGHQPARYPVEGGGGADRHPSMQKPLVARRLTLVQV